MKQAPKVGWSGGRENVAVEVRTVYELLDVIRRRPGIFIGEATLSGLHYFVEGVRYALFATGDPFDDEDPPFRGFHDWIARRYGFSESTSGWRSMLLTSIGDETAAFERFFIELDEYRARPTKFDWSD